MKSSSARLSAWQTASLLLLACLVLPSPAASLDSASYTNFTREGPVQIHVVRIPRRSPSLELRSLHSGGKPLGLSTITDQLKLVDHGAPIAAINGDFYLRDGPFAGDPRGTQIVNGELISAPVGSTTFWIDAANEPHIANIQSAIKVTWPDGSTSPVELNGKCEAKDVELYTPAAATAGASNSPRQIMLIPVGSDTNAPFRPGRDYSMKVYEHRNANGAVAPGAFVLAIGSAAVKAIPELKPGSLLKISTATAPSLRGVRTAISAGPILVTSGKPQKIEKGSSESYQYSSMLEKHPRSAIGWNATEYIWAEVDGRSKESVGMTLTELAALMADLGCEEAMNLDGGGSATLWFDGKVRNKPCDGYERPIANSLVLVRKEARQSK